MVDQGENYNKNTALLNSITRMALVRLRPVLDLTQGSLQNQRAETKDKRII